MILYEILYEENQMESIGRNKIKCMLSKFLRSIRRKELNFGGGGGMPHLGISKWMLSSDIQVFSHFETYCMIINVVNCFVKTGDEKKMSLKPLNTSNQLAYEGWIQHSCESSRTSNTEVSVCYLYTQCVSLGLGNLCPGARFTKHS